MCFLDSVADVSDKTDIFDSICVHRLAALHLFSGAWSEEEESQLLHAMKGLTKEGRTDKSARGYWVSVSNALDATRTPNSAKINGAAFFAEVAFIMPRSHNSESAGMSHSEARSEMQARHGAGNMRTAIF